MAPNVNASKEDSKMAEGNSFSFYNNLVLQRSSIENLITALSYINLFR